WPEHERPGATRHRPRPVHRWRGDRTAAGNGRPPRWRDEDAEDGVWFRARAQGVAPPRWPQRRQRGWRRDTPKCAARSQPTRAARRSGSSAPPAPSRRSPVYRAAGSGTPRAFRSRRTRLAGEELVLAEGLLDPERVLQVLGDDRALRPEQGFEAVVAGRGDERVVHRLQQPPAHGDLIRDVRPVELRAFPLPQRP